MWFTKGTFAFRIPLFTAHGLVMIAWIYDGN